MLSIYSSHSVCLVNKLKWNPIARTLLIEVLIHQTVDNTTDEKQQ